MKKFVFVFICLLAVISCSRKENKADQPVAKDEKPVANEIDTKNFKPENVSKLFYNKDLKTINLLFEDKDFFENFSKTPYAIAVVMRFFPDKVFSQYVEKLKESNLPVKENKVCLLDAIVNMESDCIPWLLEQGLSPYDVVDYNGTNMNAFDCVDWQENNIRTWNTPYKERYINTLKEIRKLLTEGVKKL